VTAAGPGRQQEEEAVGPGRQQEVEAVGPAREQEEEAVGPGRQQEEEAVGPARQQEVEAAGLGRQQEVEADWRWKKNAPARITPAVMNPRKQVFFFISRIRLLSDLAERQNTVGLFRLHRIDPATVVVDPAASAVAYGNGKGSLPQGGKFVSQRVSCLGH
jgi:hypothetical protein